MRLLSKKKLVSPPPVQHLKGRTLFSWLKRWREKIVERTIWQGGPRGKGVWWSLPLHCKHIHLSFTNAAVVGRRILLHIKWTPLLSDAWLHLLWISCLVAPFFFSPSGFMQSLQKINSELDTIKFTWGNWVPPNNCTVLGCKFFLYWTQSTQFLTIAPGQYLHKQNSCGGPGGLLARRNHPAAQGGSACGL